jgi:hypothetical protein
MSSTWADLFKADRKIVENSNPQCNELEISNGWICVDDKNNCEDVTDLGKHEFLSDDQKERRAQWQKRLQKGRSKQQRSMPSKARSRKSSNQTAKTEKNNQVQSSATSLKSSNLISQEVSLRAKLRLAVEAASGANNEENEDDVASSSFQAHREKIYQKTSRSQRGSRRLNPIQQPCQRGMN